MKQTAADKAELSSATQAARLEVVPFPGLVGDLCDLGEERPLLTADS